MRNIFGLYGCAGVGNIFRFIDGPKTCVCPLGIACAPRVVSEAIQDSLLTSAKVIKHYGSQYLDLRFLNYSILLVVRRSIDHSFLNYLMGRVDFLTSELIMLRMKEASTNNLSELEMKFSDPEIPGLFKKSALAMFEQMILSADLPRKPRKKVVKVELRGLNQEELLVNFLKELLKLSDSKNVIFKEVEVMLLTVNELRAIAVGIPLRHFQFKNQIKAVSFKGLKITHLNKQYHAQIIFVLHPLVN